MAAESASHRPPKKTTLRANVRERQLGRMAAEEDHTEGERQGKTAGTHGFTPGFASSDPSARLFAERYSTTPRDDRGLMASVRALLLDRSLFFLIQIKVIVV
jgi:hypothetical protein